MMRIVVIGLAAAGICGALGLQGLAVSAQNHDPAKGKTIYQSLCARCHGVDGKGQGTMTFNPPVADLTSPEVQNKLDAGLFKRVHEGKPNTAMGAWRSALSDEEILEVVAYIRTLAH
jgi:mono/diheme cytochrome c family protein